MSKASNSSRFFYQGDKLATLKQDNHHRSFFRSAALPLAEQQTNRNHSTNLLATDEKGSVLNAANAANLEEHLYSAYGHNPTLPSARIATGFNGEIFAPDSTCYLLGLGYRAYSPRLMRFRSADTWSPFGQGGVNAYAYCSGDPINYTDPSGHVLTRINSAPPLSSPTRRTPRFLAPQGHKINRRFQVEHYESSSRTVIEPTGKGLDAKSKAVTTTRRTLHTTELFEVVVDPHKGSATAYVTRTNLDSFLEVSNTLRAAEAMNALDDPAKTVSLPYLNNLENRRLGLTLAGEALARRATDPNDLTAWVSPSAAAIRRV